MPQGPDPVFCDACASGLHGACMGWWDWCTCTSGSCLTDLMNGEPDE